MSYNQIYPPLGVTMSNHYQSISLEEEKDYQSRLKKQKEEDYQLKLAKQKEERERYLKEAEELKRKETFYQRNYQEIHITLCAFLLIILAFIALYVLSILLGTLIIVSNYLFETSMVALFGRAIYNKNFPICTNDVYQGSDCYTRTSTYCT